MDGHGQPRCDLQLLGVDRADELGEAERLERALLFASGETGQQDGDVASEVFTQPRLVVVVAVEVGDVEEVGVLDPVAEVVTQLIVAGEDEPRSEERRHEPGVADDRARIGFDEDAGVADGRGAHRIRVGRPSAFLPAGAVGCVPGRAGSAADDQATGDQATGGSVNC
jgi:hypothetical protein